VILLPKSFRKCITPYIPEKTVYKHPDGFTLSFGESHAGYDIRVSGDSSVVRLNPGEFKLMVSYEYFNMPDNIMALVKDKSTLARKGISVFNTVIEPGWKGYLTLEVVNQGGSHVNFYVGMPIAQILFFQVEGAAEAYDGKYQDQKQVPIESL
jgi:dCTP deaminase